jgi:two-component system response regulator FixJ
LLESFGFTVQSYSCGIEFLADQRRRTAGCLVIDQHMPGMTGLDVISNLQREGVQVTAMLISGRFEPDTRACAARLGVCELLEKPFAAGRLIELVRAMVSELD